MSDLVFTRNSEGMLLAAVPERLAPEYLELCVPNGKLLNVQSQDGPYTVFAPNAHALQLLRNSKVSVPDILPIDVSDLTGFTPFESQIETAGLLCANPRAFVNNEIGTGKTLSTLLAFHTLKKMKHADKMLVLCPLSVMESVWVQEAFMRFPHYKTSVIHGSAKTRLKRLEDDADIYILNHDAVWLPTLQKPLHEAGFDIVVVDELALYRNFSTRRCKALDALVNRPAGPKFVWGLTGSPIPKDACDAYAQIRIVKGTKPGGMSMTQFKSTVMHQVSPFKWENNPNALDTVYEFMTPATRVTRDDCAELPDTSYQTIAVPKEPAQEALISELENDFYSEHKGADITVANAAILWSKTLQVLGGCIYDDDRDPVMVGAEKRLNILTDILEAASHKCIVFVPYIHLLEMVVAEELTKKGLEFSSVSGKVSKKKRDAIFDEFQNTDEPRILLAHPQCCAHGLTLTAANSIIWYTPTPSLEIYEQANGRITRHGQKHKTFIYKLVGSSVEKEVYTILAKRGNAQSALLNMIKNRRLLK